MITRSHNRQTPALVVLNELYAPTRIPNMTIDWALMQALLLVSDAGSYRAAAKTISLNTLRKRVAELERRVGAPLITASVSGIAPTVAGLKAIETAKAMRAALEVGITPISIKR